MSNVGIGMDPRAGMLTMPPAQAADLFGFAPEQDWRAAPQATLSCTGPAGSPPGTWEDAWKDYRALPAEPAASPARDVTEVLVPRQQPVVVVEPAKESVLVRTAPQEQVSNEPAAPPDASAEAAEMEEQMAKTVAEMEQMFAQIMQMLQSFMGSMGFGTRQQY